MDKAKSYCRSYDYKKAIDCFDKALKIDPKHTNALNNKGASYINLNEY